VTTAGAGNDDLAALGFGQSDADELAVMQAADALLDSMLERFLTLDLSGVAVDGELQYGRPPREP